MYHHKMSRCTCRSHGESGDNIAARCTLYMSLPRRTGVTKEWSAARSTCLPLQQQQQQRMVAQGHLRMALHRLPLSCKAAAEIQGTKSFLCGPPNKKSCHASQSCLRLPRLLGRAPPEGCWRLNLSDT